MGAWVSLLHPPRHPHPEGTGVYPTSSPVIDDLATRRVSVNRRLKGADIAKHYNVQEVKSHLVKLNHE